MSQVLVLFRDQPPGLLEGVKVHHYHVNWRNVVFSNGCNVGGILAPVKDSAVHLGMQRLHAAVEHFGEAGNLGNVPDRDPGVAQQLRRSPS